MASKAIPLPDMNATIGVVLVGLAVTTCLFGVATGQAGWYYKHYGHDRKLLQFLVATVWCLDACHLMLYGATMWVYLVDKKFVASGMTNLPWMSNVQILCNAFVVIVVQSFYTFRIMSLSKSLILTAALALFVVADFGLASTLFIESFMIESVNDDINLQAFDVALNAVTAATDLLLSGTLVTLLVRSRTGSRGSNRLINRLLFYTINTGLLTSVCAVLSLLTVLLLPAASIYVVFYYIGTHLYSISLLSMLNARAGLRTRVSDDPHYTDVATSRLTGLLQRLAPRARANSQRQLLRQLWDPAASPRSPGIVVSIRRDTTIAFDAASHDVNWKDTEEEGVYETYRPTPSGRTPTLDVAEVVVGAEEGEEDAGGGDWVQVVDPARLRLTPSPFFR
ncbi:hypothetical protein C8Q78DRAFT_786875 [Trametes maxima]|nr:hypothetical protein C8Q78DRAFT_786875 [Trametes maxima]